VTLAREPKDQEQLIAYVREALARIDRGEAVDPAALCRDHPQFAQPLAEVLGLSAELPRIQQAALRDPLAGLVLAGRYRLDSCLGRGAMGVVYRGEDQELRRTVAVKILDARLFRDPQAEQRFQREAEALAALQHSNVVAVFDRGRTAEGIHYLVMELLEGCTLAALLDRVRSGADPLVATADALGGVPAESHWPRLCARWAVDLAQGLAAAHARGLVHRDVKPSNVFLRRDGRPVLLDFGIAARADDERLTATQTTLGTPWYMAPEQVRAGALGQAEPTLDVYGLGATLYHLLAGRPPYEGDAAAVLAALPHVDPMPLGRVRADLPRDLQAIVDQCLERDPSRRYATGGALAADLGAFLRHQPVQARPLGALARQLRAWRRAPAKPIAVAALVLAAIVLAVAVPVYRQQRAIADAAALRELHARLPSLLAVEGWPEERVVAELRGEHEAAIAQLGAILAFDPDDLPVRLFRAALRLDLGDGVAAAADLRFLAAAAASPYLSALAQRYLAAGERAAGAMAIDTQGLPEPATAADCYVAGFHELRARHVRGYAGRADALLARAAASYLPARDLRLMSAAAMTEDPEHESDAARLLQFVHDESLQLEVVYGSPTARTLAMRGMALCGQRRFREAVAPLEASLRLRPDRHGPHQNLGICYRRLGDLDAAERHLQAALRLRPFAWNTKYTLAQVARDRGDFAAANAFAEQVPTTGLAGQAWKQPDLVGYLATAECIALLDVDQDRARAAATRAIAAYDRALAVRPKSRVLQIRRQYATALAADRREDAVVVYATELVQERDLDEPNHVANLAALLPRAGLGAEQTAFVRAILLKLAAQQAGGNEALRERLRRQIDAVLAPHRRER
jgi:serine/threonine-protein kinase